MAPHRRTGEPPAPRPGGTATTLLDAYRTADARFFASPGRTLLAHGTAAEVPHGEGPLAPRVAEALAARTRRGHPPAIVVGTIPFDPTAPAALAVPRTVRWAPPLRDDPLIALPAPRPAPARWRLREIPTAHAYAASVAEAVHRIRAGRLRKVVLARTLELTSDDAPDIPTLLRRLARRDPGGYTFAMPTGPGRVLLGASPELLVSRHGTRVTANPLAGSAPRGTDPAEDAARAAALLRSAKDLAEHAVVVDAVRETLAPRCTRLDVPARPALARTATMWHLSTTATGELTEPVPSALELACALHPTPAVCGAPTAPARELIGELEPFDRGHYAGIVGWGDARGDGEWVVTLRCAEADGRHLRLYAGAGIVADSTPDAETAETAAKFRTFLHAMGAEP
ncbi:isochorismate synthase [Streptomyces sp. NPDC002537]